MDKVQTFIYINELFQIYGPILTKKQQDIMESYYVYNLSINEIADDLLISKAAVSNALKVSTARLYELEGIVRHHAFRRDVEELNKELEASNTKTDNNEILAPQEDKNGI